MVRLPALSLIRFKCVSKQWLSLISDPYFSRRHTLRNPNPKISAFFDESLKSIPPEIPSKPLPVPSLLFLCHVAIYSEHHPLHVVNPTTNQFRALFSPNIQDEDMYDFVRYGLAFDPSKSPHYKVGAHDNFKEMAMHFDARSSESTVFCNGILHWIKHSHYASLSLHSHDNEFFRPETDVSHYFDLAEERMGLVSSTPPLPLLVKNMKLTWPRLRQRYFGESARHLYLIETYQHCNTQFDVMEMERDYSGWFVKYHVDLNPLVAAFPGLDWNAFVVLGLFPENGVEEIIQLIFCCTCLMSNASSSDEAYCDDQEKQELDRRVNYLKVPKTKSS
ncbi:hypothetical protein ACLB2K_008349 [Fragaria x ananassa]